MIVHQVSLVHHIEQHHGGSHLEAGVCLVHAQHKLDKVVLLLEVPLAPQHHCQGRWCVEGVSAVDDVTTNEMIPHLRRWQSGALAQ